MEEIKDLFIKYFGFFPEVISTTEHSYISPPSRVISSLIKLSEFKNKKILRLVMTDKFANNPEGCVQKVCLPHILNKNLLNLSSIFSKEESIDRFYEDIVHVDSIFKDQLIFSENEINNYIELIDIYKDVLSKNIGIDMVGFYDSIMNEYLNLFQLNDLLIWTKNTPVFGVDSTNVRLFLKESLSFLCKVDPIKTESFGKFLESNNRFKKEEENVKQNISWCEYLEELGHISSTCSIPFEIILYVYSYCGGGSHFGNDYGIVSHINYLRNNTNILQLTQHNKDFSFNLEIKDVQFQRVSYLKNKWTLSHRLYKSIKTLPELYIFLGKRNLQIQFKKIYVR